MFHAPEEFRLTTGNLRSDKSWGNNGVFQLPAKRYTINAIISDGMGWEHVSVSLSSGRLPTWKEMCAVKAVFWDAEDAVMQLHPPESEYINNHPACLHLWRPVNQTIPKPPSMMVGFKELNLER